MRRNHLRTAFTLALTLLLTLAAAAQGRTPPDLPAPSSPEDWAAFFRPDPGFTEIGGAQVPMPTRTLAQAALMASGVPPERMEYYIDKLREAFEPLRGKASGFEDPALRGEAILPFLHLTLFKEYREDATTVNGVIDTGFYNCVSSAVVYLLAARVLVLDVQGVQTPDHAFCILKVPGRDIDVEATSPFGFDPGTEKRFKSSFTKTTRFAYVPPGDYARRKTISEKELIALIMQNRAVVLQREGRYVEILRIAVDRAAAFPGTAASEFLADSVSNVLVTLSRKGDFSGSLSLAQSALAFSGPEPRFTEMARMAAQNFVAASHNRFAEYYNARDYNRARKVIEEALRRLPDDKVLRGDLAALK